MIATWWVSVQPVPQMDRLIRLYLKTGDLRSAAGYFAETSRTLARPAVPNTISGRFLLVAQRLRVPQLPVGARRLQ